MANTPPPLYPIKAISRLVSGPKARRKAAIMLFMTDSLYRPCVHNQGEHPGECAKPW